MSAERIEHELHRRVVKRNLNVAVVCVTADFVLLCGRWLGVW